MKTVTFTVSTSAKTFTLWLADTWQGLDGKIVETNEGTAYLLQPEYRRRPFWQITAPVWLLKPEGEAELVDIPNMSFNLRQLDDKRLKVTAMWSHFDTFLDNLLQAAARDWPELSPKPLRRRQSVSKKEIEEAEKAHLLSFEEGMNQQAIARAMGMDRKTVKKRLDLWDKLKEKRDPASKS